MSFTEHTGAEAGITRVEEDELLWVRYYLVGPRVMDSPHHGGGVQDLLQEVNHSFVIPAASSRLSIGHTCRKSTRTMLPRPPALVPPNSRVWSSFCPTRWDMVCLANMCPAGGKREKACHLTILLPLNCFIPSPGISCSVSPMWASLGPRGTRYLQV